MRRSSSRRVRVLCCGGGGGSRRGASRRAPLRRAPSEGRGPMRESRDRGASGSGHVFSKRERDISAPDSRAGPRESNVNTRVWSPRRASRAQRGSHALTNRGGAIGISARSSGGLMGRGTCERNVPPSYARLGGRGGTYGVERAPSVAPCQEPGSTLTFRPISWLSGEHLGLDSPKNAFFEAGFVHRAMMRPDSCLPAPLPRILTPSWNPPRRIPASREHLGARDPGGAFRDLRCARGTRPPPARPPPARPSALPAIPLLTFSNPP